MTDYYESTTFHLIILCIVWGCSIGAMLLVLYHGIKWLIN